MSCPAKSPGWVAFCLASKRLTEAFTVWKRAAVWQSCVVNNQSILRPSLLLLCSAPLLPFWASGLCPLLSHPGGALVGLSSLPVACEQVCFFSLPFPAHNSQLWNRWFYLWPFLFLKAMHDSRGGKKTTNYHFPLELKKKKFYGPMDLGVSAPKYLLSEIQH